MSLSYTLGINIQDALKRWGCILECAECLHGRDLCVSQGRQQREKLQLLNMYTLKLLFASASSSFPSGLVGIPNVCNVS